MYLRIREQCTGTLCSLFEYKRNFFSFPVVLKVKFIEVQEKFSVLYSAQIIPGVSD